MKILVTGGTGFIGSHVVRALLARKHTVRCLIRPGSNRANLAGLEVEYVIGDLNDTASLKVALHDCDELFHVAADYRLWSLRPQELERTNVEGSRALLQAASDAKLSKIVFTSSVAAVGRPSPPAPLPNQGEGGRRPGEGLIGHEGLDPLPAELIGPYKRSKFASDQLARQFAKAGLPVVIVNPSTPIGSHDIKPTPTGKLIVDFLNGKMPAYVDTGLNFVDVEDVALGHVLAGEKGKPGERYILGHKNLSLKEFLHALAEVAKMRPPRFQIPYAVAYMAGAASTGLSYFTRREPAIPLDGVRMSHAPMYYDASKAVRELGLPQTPISTALAKAVAWFKANGYVR
jgi:dihydroflavonol-4-reductase